jgi:hypothetical protein
MVNPMRLHSISLNRNWNKKKKIVPTHEAASEVVTIAIIWFSVRIADDCLLSIKEYACCVAFMCIK